MNNCNKKNKYYYNNNIYPIKNNYNCFCKNNIVNSFCCPLFEVENFLCNINKVTKLVKLIKYID